MQYIVALIALASSACTPRPAPQAVPPSPPTVTPASPAPAASATGSHAPEAAPAGAPVAAPGRAPGGTPASEASSASDEASGARDAEAPATKTPATKTPAAEAPAPGGAEAGGGLAALERGIVEEINRVRRDPRAYARALSTYRTYYDGAFLRLPGRQVALRTFEGVAAVDEAIAVARKGKPARPLRASPGLSRAARAHAQEIGQAGSIDHTSADGAGPFARMKRHGEVAGMSGENIGTAHTEADIMVMDLFIDDGVPSRGHRDNLLEARYGVVGVGCAPHRTYDIVCVMDFAEGFTAQ